MINNGQSIDWYELRGIHSDEYEIKKEINNVEDEQLTEKQVPKMELVVISDD